MTWIEIFVLHAIGVPAAGGLYDRSDAAVLAIAARRDPWWRHLTLTTAVHRILTLHAWQAWPKYS